VFLGEIEFLKSFYAFKECYGLIDFFKLFLPLSIPIIFFIIVCKGERIDLLVLWFIFFLFAFTVFFTLAGFECFI